MFPYYVHLSVIGLLFIIISSFLFVVLFVFSSLFVAKAAFCISRNPTSIPSHRLMRDVPSAARSAIVCTKGLATIFELVPVPLDEVDGFLSSLEQHLQPPTIRAHDAVPRRFHSSSFLLLYSSFAQVEAIERIDERVDVINFFVRCGFEQLAQFVDLLDATVAELPRPHRVV